MISMIMMPRRAVRRLLLPLGATLASAWAVPVSAGPLTYEQALRLAAANAPSLKARAAATAGARSSAVAADRLPDPTLDLGLQNFPVSGPNAGSFTRDDFTMATIGFSQAFPNLAKRHAPRAPRPISVSPRRASWSKAATCGSRPRSHGSISIMANAGSGSSTCSMPVSTTCRRP
jgi:cobalt-zinc-cadmium efflux system outer membrane protein